MGGAVGGWGEGRGGGSGADVYVQHVDVAGVVQWPVNGVQVCDAANGQDGARVLADGQGGAAVVWRGFRRGGRADRYPERRKRAGQVADLCTATALLGEGAEG